MADVVLSRKEILSILKAGQIDARYSNLEDSAFLPVPLSIDIIEKEKKGGNKTPLGLKRMFHCLPECVNVIPLSSRGLYNAMNDQNFSEKYKNRTGNPIEFATEASAYEIEGWWDRNELLESIQGLSWM